ncbi:GDP-mannose dehydrogenase [Candidatus Nitrosopelagicus brevis]|uniref:UDP-N-acetyl-D-mannosamine dehydrogenase n=2 Tax=Candidatus Nitrosopelagicus brevis TaxID=1410606 RepID=A0A0A7V934_9ARCH|nr:nucleotide sugar dehydrogenase [Candidatus Nitrosopelagicus brevis]PTL87689.1 GDP-mannose dehydrogenase [Candidatus Nitrosopelagicus brevis]
MNNVEAVSNSLTSKSLKVCVIGIGRIGLPTALSFAKSGLETIGVDINESLVQNINSGKFPLKDEPGYDKIFDDVIKNKKFSATTNIEKAVPNSDLVLLSLPTPMDENNVPDYSALRTVGMKLSEVLSPNSLVIVESTIEPGFIEDEMVSLISKSDRLKINDNFFIGVCPENANPGEILHDFTNLPRLVGGINQNITQIIKSIYNFVFNVELVEMPNCKTANAVKLTTNVFRDINIAYISELALMFEKLGIDTNIVLEAAKKKYNFQVHYPGSGVGGPCLPINSYQLLNTARRTNSNLSIIESGRKINEKMPEHVINLTLDGFQECNQNIKEATILILGISYKPNVKDIQLTPAEIIIKKLQELGVTVCIYDPYFKDVDVFGIKSEKNLDDIIPNVDAAIIVTGHDEFKKLELSKFSQMKNKILIDTRGIIEPNSAKNENLIFRGLGRG